MPTRKRKTIRSQDRWLILITCIILSIAGISFFIGVSDTPDSFQYLALGRFLYEGKATPMPPFHLDKPSTLFAPLYAMLVTPIYSQQAPTGALMIPFFQLILLVLGAWLIYQAALIYFPKRWAVLTAVIYLCLPFNIIYATFMMSETLSEFWIALCIFILSRIGKRPITHTWSLLVLVSSLAVLTRFANLPVFFVSLVGWTAVVAMRIVKRAKIASTAWLPACVGLALVIAWVLFGHKYTNAWSLSLFSGRHLYNNVVTAGKFLPPSDHATMQPFLAGGREADEMFAPWWDIQRWFAFSGRPEREVDRLFWQVSVAAILHNPFAYAAHVAGMAVKIPTTIPYLRDHLIEDFRACRYASCLSCVPTPYNNFDCWQEKLCRAPITFCPTQTLWSNIIASQAGLYPVITLILFLITVAGSIIAVISRNIFLRIIALSFVFLHVFNASTEWVEGRFLIPLYPLYAILFTTALKTAFKRFAHILNNK